MKSLDRLRAGAYVLHMIDGRTAIAKHTKWVGALLFAILAVTVLLEGLG